jgi:hypothetical protein
MAIFSFSKTHKKISFAKRERDFFNLFIIVEHYAAKTATPLHFLYPLGLAK